MMAVQTLAWIKIEARILVLINLKLLFDFKIQLENIKNLINSQEMHNTNTLATFIKTY